MDEGNPLKIVTKSFKKADVVPAGYYSASLASLEVKFVKDKEDPMGPKVPKLLWTFGVSGKNGEGIVTLWTSNSIFNLGKLSMTCKAIAPDEWDPTMSADKDGNQGDADRLWAHAKSLVGREINMYISVNDKGYNQIDSIAPVGPSPKKKKELTPFEAEAPAAVEDDINF